MTRILTSLFVLGAVGSCWAQQATTTDPAQGYNLVVQAINNEKWDEGLGIVNGVIQAHATTGKEEFGPVFGHFYFLRGLLQMGKKNYDGAAKSFQTCYENFPNDKLVNKPGDKRGLQPNLFRIAALVQWANVEMFQEKWAEARDLYEKSLAEGPNDPRVNRTYIAVNLGRCYIKAGELEKGYDFISRPLGSDKASAGLKETIFFILSEDWSPEVKLPQVREFLDQFRGVATQCTPEERFEFNPRFRFLAQTAIEQSDPIRALAWYGVTVDPRVMAPVLSERIASIESREVQPEQAEQKRKILETLRGELAKLDAGYWDILNGVGSAHFQMQNFTASFVAFRELSDKAGTHELRPTFLHNVVASAAKTEKWAEAYKYGKAFLAEFPDHDLEPAVARMLVEVVFLRGEYQEAYDIATDVREGMEAGSSIRDIPDFITGASAFHLDRIAEAELELDAYRENYPEGERREPVEFYAGLTKVRLQNWPAAAEILNGFLETYPNSGMTPSALYQCAMSEFMIDELEAALAKVERVLTEFPDHDVAASTWNLKGDIFVSQELTFEEVEVCYLNGKRIADEKGDEPETAAYALWQLEIHSASLELWDRAIAFEAEFQEKHPESDYRFDFLAASLPTLVHAGRTGEALTRLRAAAWEFGDQPESSVLSEMFGTYFEFLKDNFETPAVIAELEEQRLKDDVPPALAGWLAVARIEMVEATAEEDQLANEVAVEFYKLQAKFDPAQQANFVIVQLARWLAREQRKPDEAKPLYDFILENRPDTVNYDYALLDTAEIQAQSDDPAEREQALAKFKRVITEIPNEELRELAVLGTARLYAKEKKFAEAQPFWEQYLDDRSWVVSRPEANYEYAACLDQQGLTEDALKIYVSVYANFPGHLDWSTRAYIRTALIMKQKGEELKALLVLRDMIQRMGHHKHPGVKQGMELFVKWKAEYQPAPKEASS